MGIRFRKSIGNKFFRVNVSKSGIGYSAGIKGARITKTAKGTTRTTASIPGTGLSYVNESGKPAAAQPQEAKGGCLLTSLLGIVVIIVLMPFKLLVEVIKSIFKRNKGG